jgi:hypothetical protein
MDGWSVRLVAVGAMVIVAGATVASFQHEVYDHRVDLTPSGVSDAEDVRQFESLSENGRSAFLNALEVARETESDYAEYTVTGDSNKPPEFVYVSDASVGYVVEYEGERYQLYTSGEVGGMFLAMIAVLVTVLAFVVFAAGLRATSNRRAIWTGIGSVGVLLAFLYLEVDFPGYRPLLPTLAERHLTLLAVAAGLWVALGAAGVGSRSTTEG